MQRVRTLCLSAAAILALEGAAFATPADLLQQSTLPFQAPPFSKIKDADFGPAFDAAMTKGLAEFDAIANNPAPPTFENTIVAMEKSDQALGRVQLVFSTLTGANTDDALQKVEATEAPKLAAHQDAIFLNGKLFARVNAIYQTARLAQSRSGVAPASRDLSSAIRACRRQSFGRRQGRS